MEVTGGNTTLTTDIDDVKARATTAFSESMKKVCVLCIHPSNNVVYIFHAVTSNITFHVGNGEGT